MDSNVPMDAPMGGEGVNQMPPMDNGEQQNMPEPPVDNGMPEQPEMQQGNGGGEIQQKFDSLSPEHQKAVKAYIESMEDQETDNGGAENEGDMPPMQESYCFTKGQLKKAHKQIK